MEGYLEHTREAFNKIASSYDESDNRNKILTWMRGIVHKIYLQNLKPGDKVLELNSGTGADAIFLAQNGINVFATDISDEMINTLNKNAFQEIQLGKIQSKRCSFEEINSIEQSGFNAVLSNFGGLNCINDFKKISSDIYNKLKPNGNFIAVVMNKICPWEIFYYTLKLNFKNAFRRFNKNGIDADLNGEKVKTFYFSPGEFAGWFGNDFAAEKIYSLGLYTPPPYLIGIYNRLKPLVMLWMKLDQILKGIFPFNRFGDHFIIVLRRK